jgi:GNAT superfamily N-acetyltransferase
MASRTEPAVREALPEDVSAICAFGSAHIRPHYAPLIGAAAAEAQVRDWWNPTHIGAAVAAGLVVVADSEGQLVGVGQRGRNGDDHVIYKLYVDTRHRGHGLGPHLVAALTSQLPDNARRLYLEHFAANRRAGAFYEREGFTVVRIEASSTGDAALDVVWRVRDLTSAQSPGAG